VQCRPVCNPPPLGAREPQSAGGPHSLQYRNSPRSPDLPMPRRSKRVEYASKSSWHRIVPRLIPTRMRHRMVHSGHGQCPAHCLRGLRNRSASVEGGSQILSCIDIKGSQGSVRPHIEQRFEVVLRTSTQVTSRIAAHREAQSHMCASETTSASSTLF
jgi:hypothetical protein